MDELVLDASGWYSKDDVYDSFFRAVGAPEWHGRNLDALADSIAGGQINRVEVPYKVLITNYDRCGDGAREMASRFVDLLRELAGEGCPIQIEVRP